MSTSGGTIGSLAPFNPDRDKIDAYLECVQLFMDTNGIRGDEKCVAVLLTAIGSDIYALLRSLLSPAKPREKSFQNLVDMLQHHFDPKPLVIAERFHFHRRDQAEGESITEYLSEFRCLVTHCKFEEYFEQTLRDHLVCGIHHENTQKRLLLESNLTLTTAVGIAWSVEAAEKQSTQLNKGY